MQTQFTASQSVKIPLAEGNVPVEDYLQEPRRVVQGLTDASQVEVMGPERFRFSLRPLSFLSLEICPTAELQVWSPQPGQVKIRAVRCWLEGADHLNQHFDLAMEGYLQTLRSDQSDQKVTVKGQANLNVTVDLPMPFSLTPKPIVEAAGNALLSSILSTIQRRLKQQLRADYQAWAQEQCPVQTLS